MELTRRTLLVVALAVVVALAAAACGDDSTSEGNPSSETSVTTVATSSAGSAGTVVVAQVDPSDAVDDLEGTPVDPGMLAEMGPLVVTVDMIEADVPGSTLKVWMSADNPTADLQAGPDVYSVCTDDGRVGLIAPDSEIESLSNLEAGQSSAGVALVEVPPDCESVIVQVRVLAIEPGGDHIADYAVPASALS